MDQVISMDQRAQAAVRRNSSFDEDLAIPGIGSPGREFGARVSGLDICDVLEIAEVSSRPRGGECGSTSLFVESVLCLDRVMARQRRWIGYIRRQRQGR